jgi:hypothetical protein
VEQEFKRATSGVHKAWPMPLREPPVCSNCRLAIKNVPGGMGPVWVHAATGMVAGPGAPGSPSSTQSDVPLNRYRINDALSALAMEMGVDLGENALDELTHHVAEMLEKARVM